MGKDYYLKNPVVFLSCVGYVRMTLSALWRIPSADKSLLRRDYLETAAALLAAALMLWPGA